MKDKRQNRLVLAALAVLTLGAMALSLCVGSQGVALPRLLAALRAGDPADPVRRIVLYVRLPRMAAGLCCGAAMAVAGALLQAVLNNAMASPNVIGVNAGAGFFALLAGVLLPQRAVPGAAFAGALVTALLIYLLALRAGLARTTLVLAGLAVSGILTAGVNTMRLLFPEGVTGADGFLIGGLSGVSLTAVGSALPYLAAGGVLALFLAPELNILALGEQTAASLGLPVGRTRLASILAAALLAGAAVSFAGLISFVGLLVPHIARRLVGVDHRVLLPACALLGAIFLLVCDTAARTLFAPYELPVGILLNVIGGVFFLYLLLGRKRGRVYD
ncbi:iron ABC transporter permease [bacterium]|uniref:FecCD family ABC transporter permease n=1 Tax=Gemmiger sp. TaxID=2049027 RepID=UPI002A8392A8|nr:iron ABC transporter permease [Gemmiger sp.]MCI5556029.1 iron ABC transporter permease [bacterium]MCI6083792.1 iron ABC transporter permease [bacterium]MCI6176343.1 iron ABC transporter permease [bacterium]MCI7192096.1 iron ABC transporter permease [bacterium]MCI7324624.1 iron ABC transporter permease [bacterium]